MELVIHVRIEVPEDRMTDHWDSTKCSVERAVANLADELHGVLKAIEIEE